MPAWTDIVGNRYGMLVVTRYMGGSKWKCLCDCGSESITGTHHLKSGNTKSCGCRKRAVLGESTTKHGLRKHPLYSTWKGIRNRCNSPNHPRYKDYGGRGIKVCKRWDAFENFIADMGERPEGYSLDRIDVNGDYEPTNCRWASNSQQRRNARDSIYVDGKHLAQIAEETGVSYWTLYDRYIHGRPVQT
jgi:hypothetical protein